MKLQKNRVSIQQVYVAINKWNINSKIADFEHINMFRCKLKKLSPIPFSFIEICIKVIMLEKFDWAFKQSVVMQKYMLDLEIKQKYQQLRFKEGFNQDFKFYFLMVLIVKTCCYFVQNNINDIKIDDIFQGEVFIILMHIVLGLKISTKTFKEVFQKYRSKLKKINCMQKKDSSCNSISKLSKVILVNQAKQYSQKLKINSASSKKSISMSKQLKRRGALSNNSRDARFSLISQISRLQDEGAQFARQVKSNLYVKPLPPSLKTRLTVRQLDIQNQNSYIPDYKRLLPNIQRQMRAISITSSQLSNSFQYLISQNGQQSPKLNTSFNINCKPKENSLYYQLAPSLPKIAQSRQNQLPLSKKQKKRGAFSMHTKQKDANRWKQVVNQLKSSRLENQNLRSRRNIRDFANLEGQKENIGNYVQKEAYKVDSQSVKIDFLRSILQYSSIKINDKQDDKNIVVLSKIEHNNVKTINPIQILIKKSWKKRGELIKSYKNFIDKCDQRQDIISGRFNQQL